MGIIINRGPHIQKNPPNFSCSCDLFVSLNSIMSLFSQIVWEIKCNWHKVQEGDGWKATSVSDQSQHIAPVKLLTLSPSFSPAAVRACTFRLAAEMSAWHTGIFGPVIPTDAFWHNCQRCPHPVSYFMWSTRPACHITQGEGQSSAKKQGNRVSGSTRLVSSLLKMMYSRWDSCCNLLSASRFFFLQYCIIYSFFSRQETLVSLILLH